MSFTYNGATIAAHEPTIGEDEDIAVLGSKINPGGDYLVKHLRFAEFQLCAEVTGDLALARVTATDTPEIVQAAYAQWRALPRSFLTRWQTELARVESGEKNEFAATS